MSEKKGWESRFPSFYSRIFIKEQAHKTVGMEMKRSIEDQINIAERKHALFSAVHQTNGNSDELTQEMSILITDLIVSLSQLVSK